MAPNPTVKAGHEARLPLRDPASFFELREALNPTLAAIFCSVKRSNARAAHGRKQQNAHSPPSTSRRPAHVISRVERET